MAALAVHFGGGQCPFQNELVGAPLTFLAAVLPRVSSDALSWHAMAHWHVVGAVVSEWNFLCLLRCLLGLPAASQVLAGQPAIRVRPARCPGRQSESVFTFRCATPLTIERSGSSSGRRRGGGGRTGWGEIFIPLEAGSGGGDSEGRSFLNRPWQQTSWNALWGRGHW